METLETVIMNGDLEAVKQFQDLQGINQSGNLDRKNYGLITACRYGKTEIVQYLISIKAEVDYCSDRPIFSAGTNGHLDTVKALIEAKANIHTNTDQLLRWSAYYGQSHVVKALIELKADVHALDEFALVYACSNCELETVKVLINAGADISINDFSVLALASLCKNRKITEYLISRTNGAGFHRLTLEDKEYFKMKRAYSRWRKVYLRRWIRNVLLPLYYSPENHGGIQAKKDLNKMIFSIK